MPDLLTVPLDRIDAIALPRDRTALDAEALDELKASIRRNGLRTPVELFALPPDEAGPRYGLIAGYRRLAACRALREDGAEGFDAVPAFLREGDRAAAFRAMVEENAVRADLSPWEQGRAIVLAVELGLYPDIEQAADGLHPAASRVKRARLRAMARAVEECYGLFTAPERLSQADLLRLADAFRNDFCEPILETLRCVRGRPHERQWEAIRPYLDECAAEIARPPEPPHKPGRPRRCVRVRPSLTVRRERTPNGYVLRFSGPEATSPLLDEVIDEIERLYGTG